jgi:hypothetical protein
MAAQQPHDDPGRVEQGAAAGYDMPTRPMRAVGDARDVDVGVWNRPEAVLPRNRVYWGAIWAGGLAALTSFIVLSLLGLAVGVSILSTSGTGVLTSEGRGSIIWETVAGIVSYLIGGYVAGHAAPVFRRSWSALNGLNVFLLSVPFILLALVVLGAIGAAASGIAAGVGLTLGHAHLIGPVNVILPTTSQAIDQARTVSWAILAWVLAAIIASYLGGALGTRRKPQTPVP